MTSANLSVSPNFDSTKSDPMNFPVNFNPAYGSFMANFTVPPSAQLLQYQLTLQLPGDASGGVSVATEDFQVADPRPPTATLNLTAPNWVRSGLGRQGSVGEGGHPIAMEGLGWMPSFVHQPPPSDPRCRPSPAPGPAQRNGQGSDQSDVISGG